MFGNIVKTEQAVSVMLYNYIVGKRNEYPLLRP